MCENARLDDVRPRCRSRPLHPLRLEIVVLVGSFLHIAAVPAIEAQEAPLAPRLSTPALWSRPDMPVTRRSEAPHVTAEGRGRSYLAMAGGSTVGSALGAGAGMLLGVGATDSLVGLLFAYPGAWLGAAVGADLTGAERSRSFLASTVGLVAGAAVLGWSGGESWGWVGFGIHGLVTALLAGGLDEPEAGG